jgi:hypothetical protein
LGEEVEDEGGFARAGEAGYYCYGDAGGHGVL